MSYTKAGFPATFAAEGNPVAGGFPGEFDPYVHTVKDTMEIEDENIGVFSIDVGPVPDLRGSVFLLFANIPGANIHPLNSTWLDFPSWPSLSLWSKRAGTTPGDRI